jgi:hypothetical protein
MMPAAASTRKRSSKSVTPGRARRRRGKRSAFLDNDDSFRLFCSIAGAGEAQGGWENSRIAALVPGSQRDLAPKVARHGADEDKHGRMFNALLRKRGLDHVPVPPETDYTMRLERAGIGLAHGQLHRDEQLTELDIVTYLVHSRVTEQRASDQMAMLNRYFADYPGVGRAVRMISNDEDKHLAYCQEELLQLAEEGHGRAIQQMLHRYARAEIRIYRDVSLAVMANIARILGWSRPKTVVLRAGIRTQYVYERLGGWRRMVSLKLPEQRDALSPAV